MYGDFLDSLYYTMWSTHHKEEKAKKEGTVREIEWNEKRERRKEVDVYLLVYIYWQMNIVWSLAQNRAVIDSIRYIEYYKRWLTHDPC